MKMILYLINLAACLTIRGGLMDKIKKDDAFGQFMMRAFLF
jgi:hypothetical protein